MSLAALVEASAGRCPLNRGQKKAIPSLVVALSGGVDSVALLYLLKTLYLSADERSSVSLRAVHVNHQLHDQAESHADFCRQLCAEWDTLLSVVTLDWSLPENRQYRQSVGIEAAARSLRYAALAEQAEPGAVVVTAHHQDDQVETLLLNLARGSGLSGLAGFAEWSVVPVALSELPLWRPLLRADKNRLRQYAIDQALSWVEDPTNDDHSLRRNYLRHQVLPSMEAVWPAFVASAARSAEHLREAESVLEECSQEWLQANAHPDYLLLASLQGLSVKRQHWLMRSWLLWSGWSPPNTDRWREFLRQLSDESSPDRHVELVYQDAMYGAPHRVIAERGCLWRLPTSLSGADDDQQVSMAWPLVSADGCAPRDSYRYPWIIGEIEVAYPRDHAISKFRFPEPNTNMRFCTLRYAQQLPFSSLLSMSSKVQLAGAAHRQPLKKLLQANNIPAWMRPYLPVLIEGEDIVWIGGVGELENEVNPEGIFASQLKLTWFCPGVSANIHPRLESSR